MESKVSWIATIAVGSVLCICARTTQAQEQNSQQSTSQEQASLKPSEQVPVKTSGSNEDWVKSFGLSLGAGLIAPNDRNITGTTVQNGIVRVTSEQDFIPALWLSSQWVYRTGRMTGFGPFIGLGMDNKGGLFDNAGIGLAFSMAFEPWKTRGEKQNALNIGVGWGVQKVSVLGDGVIENEPLPEGEESVRYKEKYSHGPMILVSFTVL